jgi:polar amino acid transport system substrate-binding protein
VTPGTLTVAIAVLGSSPPFGTYARDNKTIIGSEADIARLVADGLGLKLKLVPSAWEDWPLGVTSGKYDAAIFNITVTKERKEKFDFATYRQDTLGFYVKSTSSITSIKSAPDIAGKRIIVGSGTNQEAVLLAWDKENQAKGLKPFTPIYVTDNAASSLALQSGRADATFGPNVSAAYQSRLTGNTKLVGIVPGGWPKTANIAVTIKKGNGLVNAVQASLNSAIASGAYIKVLDRWAEASEKIDHSEINPPGLGD